jgi:hypothetical protein
MTASINNPYDALYTNLKNQFIVIYHGTECTVGDFMLMKANKKTESSLPIATASNKTTSISTFVEYVNDKLTVKQAPIKDETIKRFPLRTSVSALLSATAACALVLSCGIFALSGANGINSPKTAEKSDMSYIESFTPDVEESDIEFEIEAEEN